MKPKLRYLLLVVVLGVFVSCFPQMEAGKVTITDRGYEDQPKIHALGTLLGQLGGSWGTAVFEFSYQGHTYLAADKWIIEVKP